MVLMVFTQFNGNRKQFAARKWMKLKITLESALNHYMSAVFNPQRKRNSGLSKTGSLMEL